MSLANVQAHIGTAEGAATEHECDLIERAKRDPDAFAALYQRHLPMLLDHVFRRTGDVHATEDLVADAFLIVLRSLSAYRYRGVPLRFWLLRIATNVVNRWARQQIEHPSAARAPWRRPWLLRWDGFARFPRLSDVDSSDNPIVP